VEHGELLRPDLGQCMQKSIVEKSCGVLYLVHDMCDWLAGRLRWSHGLLFRKSC